MFRFSQTLQASLHYFTFQELHTSLTIIFHFPKTSHITSLLFSLFQKLAASFHYIFATISQTKKKTIPFTHPAVSSGGIHNSVGRSDDHLMGISTMGQRLVIRDILHSLFSPWTVVIHEVALSAQSKH